MHFSSASDAQERLLAQIQGLGENEAPHVREIIIDLTEEDDLLFQYETEDSANAISQGTWTMVMHEGMMGFMNDATIGENVVFNTVWRNNVVDEDSQTYESICYETMVGWFHTSNPENEDEEQWG